MNRISRTCKDYELEINKHKTKCMLISKKGARKFQLSIITLQDRIVERGNQIRALLTEVRVFI